MGNLSSYSYPAPHLLALPVNSLHREGWVLREKDIYLSPQDLFTRRKCCCDAVYRIYDAQSGRWGLHCTKPPSCLFLLRRCLRMNCYSLNPLLPSEQAASPLSCQSTRCFLCTGQGHHSSPSPAIVRSQLKALVLPLS